MRCAIRPLAEHDVVGGNQHRGCSDRNEPARDEAGSIHRYEMIAKGARDYRAKDTQAQIHRGSNAGAAEGVTGEAARGNSQHDKDDT